MTREKIEEALRLGDIKLERPNARDPTFLDDIRLGLHMAQMVETPGEEVDLQKPSQLVSAGHVTPSTHFLPARTYYFLSEEKLSLSGEYAALIQTRSKFARLGIELAGSSLFVIPGFGLTVPTHLVLETRFDRPTVGLSPEKALGYLLIFKVDPVEVSRKDYAARLP